VPLKTTTKKIEFFIHPEIGKENKPTNDKYLLLSYFLADSRYPDHIERRINELKLVQSGEKTFEEVFEIYATIVIGWNEGEFECDKDTAYFISRLPDHASMEMPMQELIELLEEWKAFMS